MSYQRADFGPLRDTVYGIGFHWTTWTWSRNGAPKPFEEAVECFDVPQFVEQARACGAGHVLLTATHEKHHLPGPNPEVDRILPGRTCQRDLVGEIADALGKFGIRFMVYYNHGVHHATWDPDQPQDPAWQQAVGAWESGRHVALGHSGPVPDRSRFYDNYCRVIGWMGEHYRDKLTAFWFDSGYELAKFRDMPWERITAAAKAGHPQRLVAYNAGIMMQHAYTSHQDYWAGELNGLAFQPFDQPATAAGLPWYAYCSWANCDRYWQAVEWGMNATNHDRKWPEQDPQAIANVINGFRRCGGAITFNLLCYQDGSAHPSDLATMAKVRRIVRGGKGCCA